MHIALVGLPGVGKTTVGRQLAKRLRLPFIDSDSVIESRIGMPIRDYFERHGEQSFREVEQLVIAEITTSLEDRVISTGGGAVLKEANRRCLRDHCKVIYLHSTAEDIFRRLRNDTSRPLLQGGNPLDKLRALLDQRDPLYRETAHFVMETGRPSVSTLVNMIVMQLDLAGCHFDTVGRTAS
ncbi:shikimate kinase [Curvibacter sp. APW13]|uniref:shikimate kinase n=1 Tax=Curvibacter sp. APW13 TaxID=3077236 RepID=UPI0028DEC353|nr:shikimate kinase [Curvibacter sp. APW13]MDT8989586.1 shikimate kinase [Curvibacter sp. APW13]